MCLPSRATEPEHCFPRPDLHEGLTQEWLQEVGQRFQVYTMRIFAVDSEIFNAVQTMGSHPGGANPNDVISAFIALP